MSASPLVSLVGVDGWVDEWVGDVAFSDDGAFTGDGASTGGTISASGDAISTLGNGTSLADDAKSPTDNDTLPTDNAETPLPDITDTSITSPDTFFSVFKCPLLGSIPNNERIPTQHDHFQINRYSNLFFSVSFQINCAIPMRGKLDEKRKDPNPTRIRPVPLKSTRVPIRSSLALSPIIRFRDH